MIEIIPADTEARIQHIVMLSQEYVTWMLDSIRQHYPQLDISEFTSEHSYDDIRKKFPGEHVPPFGRLYLATHDGKVAGCVALGKLSDTVGEMRTLFVRPNFRGLGVGKKLAETVLNDARAIGYQSICLDTLRFMESAYQLYRGFGFQECAPYGSASPTLQQYIRYLELKL